MSNLCSTRMLNFVNTEIQFDYKELICSTSDWRVWLCCSLFVLELDFTLYTRWLLDHLKNLPGKGKNVKSAAEIEAI